MGSKFDDIAPLYDYEVKDAIQELLNDEGFETAVRYIMPDVDWAEFSHTMSQYNTKVEFQADMIYKTVGMLSMKSTTSVKAEGWENLSKEKQHLMLSNHRDIVLDAGYLNILRHAAGFNTTEIAIGDNLLIHPWIETLVRLNKSFIVKRGLPVRQQLMASIHMSEYIHYCISEKNESIWIAQREGRAKDANDHTQISLLKMLTLSSHKTEFLESIQDLNIIPTSISYEYDPCDYLKAKEFQQKRDNPEFKKSERDDLLNMEIGIMGYKGNVLFRIGKCINEEVQKITETDKRTQLGLVAKIIDKTIHANYEIYPINYIAHDELNNSKQFADKYTADDVTKFNQYIDKQIDKIDEIEHKDMDFLRTKILEMYSNVLKNHLKAIQS